MKASLNINFFIVNQCNCYRICYRNSNFDMWVSISYFDQVLGKRESQTRHVLNFASI